MTAPQTPEPLPGQPATRVRAWHLAVAILVWELVVGLVLWSQSEALRPAAWWVKLLVYASFVVPPYFAWDWR